MMKMNTNKTENKGGIDVKGKETHMMHSKRMRIQTKLWKDRE